MKRFTTTSYLVSFICSYSNFVDVNDFGSPEEPNPTSKDKDHKADDLKAWIHLSKLIENGKALFNQEFPQFQIDLSLPVIICGFSKGCVVLNELCEELIYLNEICDNELSCHNVTKSILENFVSKVSNIIWLDGGHSGPTKAWVDNERVVKCIKDLNCNCVVYITPYQLLKMKHFEEYNKFIEILKKLNVNLVNKCYFEKNKNINDDWEYQLNMHFELLRKFEIAFINNQ